jgi:hypothetical protein
MLHTTADLIRAARNLAVERLAEPSRPPCPHYAQLAEFFRRQTRLDAIFLSRPRPSTLLGRVLCRAGGLLGWLRGRLFRLAGATTLKERTYEILLCQLEWQLACESRWADELAALQTRLRAASVHQRRPLG